MAVEGTPAPEAAPTPAIAQQASSQPAPTTSNPPAKAHTDISKPTPAQLKAKAKAEKQARRAQAKEVKAAAAATTPPTPGLSGADAKGAKNKVKQDATQPSAQQSQTRHALAHRPSMSGRRPSILVVEKDLRSSIPECFSHIPMAKRISTSQAHKDVHPAVLAVGQQMATFAIKDSIARLEATLLAFRKVSSPKH